MTEQSDAQFLADKLDCDVWHDAAAELRRLDRFEKAHQVWIEKTNWVQDVSTSKELGMHRADVLKKRIDDLAALNAELVEALLDVTVSLVAAHNLLQNGGKKAAASDKMFSLMLNDYEKSFELGRAVLAKAKEQA